jgi:Ran GTPase-activating protein (RanGAP) involved in mRNA processing and transport
VPPPRSTHRDSCLSCTSADDPAGRPEDEALDVLRIISRALASCPALQSLNLSDNALGEKGVRACAELLQQTVRDRAWWDEAGQGRAGQNVVGEVKRM